MDWKEACSRSKENAGIREDKDNTFIITISGLCRVFNKHTGESSFANLLDVLKFKDWEPKE